MNTMIALPIVAAVPVAAPAIATPPDPIYVAIERHRAEQQAYVDALVDRDKLHEVAPKEIRRGPRVELGRKGGQPYYLHSHEQIDDRLEWMPDFARTPEIRAAGRGSVSKTRAVQMKKRHSWRRRGLFSHGEMLQTKSGAAGDPPMTSF